MSAPMPRTRAFVSALFLAIAALAPLAAAADEAPLISAEELSRQTAGGSSPLLLDVRTPEEYQQGHIAGALNIPLGELDKRVSEVKTPDREVVVYCMRGGRARQAEKTLAAAGMSRIRHLDGGIAAWISAGKPVEKAPAAH